MRPTRACGRNCPIRSIHWFSKKLLWTMTSVFFFNSAIIFKAMTVLPRPQGISRSPLGGGLCPPDPPRGLCPLTPLGGVGQEVFSPRGVCPPDPPISWGVGQGGFLPRGVRGHTPRGGFAGGVGQEGFPPRGRCPRPPLGGFAGGVGPGGYPYPKRGVRGGTPPVGKYPQYSADNPATPLET